MLETCVRTHFCGAARHTAARLTRGEDMIDHTGLQVSDYARAKRFYLAALEPLGYWLLMEIPP